MSIAQATQDLQTGGTLLLVLWVLLFVGGFVLTVLWIMVPFILLGIRREVIGCAAELRRLNWNMSQSRSAQSQPPTARQRIGSAAPGSSPFDHITE